MIRLPLRSLSVVASLCFVVSGCGQTAHESLVLSPDLLPEPTAAVPIYAQKDGAAPAPSHAKRQELA